MGKRPSNGSANKEKAAKNAAATLPSIPASSAKLPQMKIFEQWLTFVLKRDKQLVAMLSIASWYFLHITHSVNLFLQFFTCLSFWPRESVNNVHGTVDHYLAKKLESKDEAHDSTCWDNFWRHQQITHLGDHINLWGQEFCIELYKFMDAQFPEDPALSWTQEFLDSIMPRSVGSKHLGLMQPKVHSSLRGPISYGPTCSPTGPISAFAAPQTSTFDCNETTWITILALKQLVSCLVVFKKTVNMFSSYGSRMFFVFFASLCCWTVCSPTLMFRAQRSLWLHRLMRSGCCQKEWPCRRQTWALTGHCFLLRPHSQWNVGTGVYVPTSSCWLVWKTLSCWRPGSFICELIRNLKSLPG